MEHSNYPSRLPFLPLPAFPMPKLTSSPSHCMPSSSSTPFSSLHSSTSAVDNTSIHLSPIPHLPSPPLPSCADLPHSSLPDGNNLQQPPTYSHSQIMSNHSVQDRQSSLLSNLSSATYSTLPTDHSGYIRILPRTTASSSLYKKRCETCTATHDGSFGAGRFCSSRCARTVGGLAHRKKRMMERDAKQRSAIEGRIKKNRSPFRDYSTVLSEETMHQVTDLMSRSTHSPVRTSGMEGTPPLTSSDGSCIVLDSAQTNLPRSSITINSLLNPTES